MADVRLIDANVLMKNIGKIPQLRGITYGRMKKAVEESPAIDAAPVVCGRWNWEGRFKACSECGTYIDWDNTIGANHWHYCPNCGAKMDGGAEK